MMVNMTSATKASTTTVILTALPSGYTIPRHDRHISKVAARNATSRFYRILMLIAMSFDSAIVAVAAYSQAWELAGYPRDIRFVVLPNARCKKIVLTCRERNM